MWLAPANSRSRTHATCSESLRGGGDDGAHRGAGPGARRRLCQSVGLRTLENNSTSTNIDFDPGGFHFWRACNALAELSATRDLQPDDPPAWIRDRLRGESRDVLIAGHFPHLPRLLSLLSSGSEAFPPHGVVALTTDDGETWKELWRLENG